MDDNDIQNAWNELVESWIERKRSSHIDLPTRFANAVAQNCKWFIGNLTLKELMSITQHLSNFRCIISEGEMGLLSRNKKLIFDWELRHHGFSIDEFDDPCIILHKQHVMLRIRILHSGDTVIQYKAIYMGEDEWRWLDNNKASFEQFYNFCDIWMSDKSAHEIRKEIENSI